jgi:hypothetical protein
LDKRIYVVVAYAVCGLRSAVCGLRSASLGSLEDVLRIFLDCIQNFFKVKTFLRFYVVRIELVLYVWVIFDVALGYIAPCYLQQSFALIAAEFRDFPGENRDTAHIFKQIYFFTDINPLYSRPLI